MLQNSTIYGICTHWQLTVCRLATGQSAAISEIVKALLVSSLTGITTAIAMCLPLGFTHVYLH